MDRNAEQARAEIVEQALATEWPPVGDVGTEPPEIVEGECQADGCTEKGSHHGWCCTHWRTR